MYIDAYQDIERIWALFSISTRLDYDRILETSLFLNITSCYNVCDTPTILIGDDIYRAYFWLVQVDFVEIAGFGYRHKIEHINIESHLTVSQCNILH